MYRDPVTPVITVVGAPHLVMVTPCVCSIPQRLLRLPCQREKLWRHVMFTEGGHFTSSVTIEDSIHALAMLNVWYIYLHLGVFNSKIG